MKKLVALLTFVLATVAFAAPAKKDPVAEGFADWNGIDDKNYITGRMITPSDLRHRVVVVIHLDANALRSGFIQTGWLLSNMGMPVAHLVVWDTLEAFPRECIGLAVIHGDCDETKYREALKAPKGKEVPDSESSALSNWNRGTYAAIYGEKAGLVGAEVPTKFPYVQILLPDSPTVAWKGEYNDSNRKAKKEINQLMTKGKAACANWRPLYGVPEVKYWTKAEKIIKEGKPATQALAILRGGIKDKDPEKAKEAQIMFDALNQTMSDLKIRISSEFANSPARAYVDLQQLIRLFPSEKKKMQTIDQKLKQNKGAKSLGQMFEKFLRWNDPSFLFKNSSEAKKAAVEVTSWKKQIELVSQDQSDTRLAGEAALLGSFLDGFAEVLLTKVPQK